jgi:hypothetical protein
MLTSSWRRPSAPRPRTGVSFIRSVLGLGWPRFNKSRRSRRCVNHQLEDIRPGVVAHHVKVELASCDPVQVEIGGEGAGTVLERAGQDSARRVDDAASAARHQDLLLKGGVATAWRSVRPTRSFHQTSRTGGLEPDDPLVPCPRANAVSTAKLPQVRSRDGGQRDKLDTGRHGEHLDPSHRAPPCGAMMPKCVNHVSEHP